LLAHVKARALVKIGSQKKRRNLRARAAFSSLNKPHHDNEGVCPVAAQLTSAALADNAPCVSVSLRAFFRMWPARLPKPLRPMLGGLLPEYPVVVVYRLPRQLLAFFELVPKKFFLNEHCGITP
jgi:hypothetical protein